MGEPRVASYRPHREAVPGEYADITRGIAKWRELLWFERKGESPIITNGLMVFVLVVYYAYRQGRASAIAACRLSTTLARASRSSAPDARAVASS